MSSNAVPVKEVASKASVAQVDMKLEVDILPVADVDRAKEFYGGKLGWRLDADLSFGTAVRVVQYTPHGSGCSIQFGVNLTAAAPGSGKGYLVVSDIQAARDALIAAGIQVSEIFHIGANGPVNGPDPEHGTYRSRAVFSDPDGNGWLLQEITNRLPGRIDSGVTSFSSTTDLTSALKRAAAAHGEHEKRIGHADPNWPEWYASYMVAEQTGAELPK
jgi:catechol 2,3-dioxygenase-like lactoylglutathione lyase family enzyme